MKCLLCENAAVADGLCVPCGAKLWAANVWLDDAHRAYRFVQRQEKGERTPLNPEHAARWLAFGIITNLYLARTFKTEVDSAQAARKTQDNAIARKDAR
jgi:hypothetical protein